MAFIKRKGNFKMSLPSFTALIVTYNSAGEISNLLDDLHLYVPNSKIIVIDNASRDGTVEVVQEHVLQVELIQNSTNVGYAKAVNQGFALCHTEYVLLLNPDIRINSLQLFAEVEKCLTSFRQIAAAAPLQFKNDNGEQYLNFTWSYSTWDAFKVYASFLMRGKFVFLEPIQVPFLNAGCLFVRKSAFEQVGRLNEKYFLYGEEPDLFLKFRRYGFECYLLPNVAVIHYRERSLMTRPVLQRLKIRIHAAWNIADALIHGWANILLDRFVVKRSQFVNGKRQTLYKKRTFDNVG
jgi:N-acetylglucosaminyl-diphospho-decaprenol L-rhamnosyltransferase